MDLATFGNIIPHTHSQIFCNQSIFLKCTILYTKAVLSILTYDGHRYKFIGRLRVNFSDSNVHDSEAG